MCFYTDFSPATSSSQFGTQFTNPPSTGTSSLPQASESQSRTSTFSETVRHSGDYMPHSQYVMPRANPPVVVEVKVYSIGLFNRNEGKIFSTEKRAIFFQPKRGNTFSTKKRAIFFNQKEGNIFSTKKSNIFSTKRGQYFSTKKRAMYFQPKRAIFFQTKGGLYFLKKKVMFFSLETFVVGTHR